MSPMAEVLDRLISVIYPHRCVLCGEVVEYDDLCCEGCVPPASGVVRLDMAHPMAAVAASFSYEDAVRALILRLKERENRRAFQFFGERMAGLMGSLWPDQAFDILIPVPSNMARMEERGFNPPERIADSLGEIAKLPVETDVLARGEDSLSQRSLSMEERRRNARRSYHAARTELLAGKTVLLIDDVVTTGSTLAACSELLLAAGCKAVYALAAANTVRDEMKVDRE